MYFALVMAKIETAVATTEKKGFFGEFHEFISKGNVMDLAVAVVLAGAFEVIIKSLVDDMIMPVIALIFDAKSLADLKWGPFTYGKFVAAVINFLIVALVLFTMIRTLNRIRRKKA